MLWWELGGDREKEKGAKMRTNERMV